MELLWKNGGWEGGGGMGILPVWVSTPKTVYVNLRVKTIVYLASLKPFDRGL